MLSDQANLSPLITDHGGSGQFHNHDTGNKGNKKCLCKYQYLWYHVGKNTDAAVCLTMLWLWGDAPAKMSCCGHRSRKETFMATNRLRETTFQHLYCFFGIVSPHNGWTQYYYISSTFLASNLLNMALHGCIIPFWRNIYIHIVESCLWWSNCI